MRIAHSPREPTAKWPFELVTVVSKMEIEYNGIWQGYDIKDNCFVLKYYDPAIPNSNHIFKIPLELVKHVERQT